jgi:hypothetical protein
VLGLDDQIASLSRGGLVMTLVVALLLGLRHATDPDHLTAVSTLLASERPGGGRRARRLGLSWGVGHATTLIALGLPAVLFSRHLPGGVQRGAELLVGAVIMALAVRLLVRWRRGYFHVHPHSHGSLSHSHPHVHEHAGGAVKHPRPHEHGHQEALGRTPLAAFGIGLLHGAGGSAAVGVLIVGATPGRLEAAIALVLFAAATAVSMLLLSAIFGLVLARGPVLRRLAALAPAFGAVSLVFGLLYALAAL